MAESLASAQLDADVVEQTLGDDEPTDVLLHKGDPLEPGSTVGRYTVLQRIGSGGMGVVYAAFDPQLDRRIALKVMHAATEGSAGSANKSRLLREAQAMAKLSHPNVITVHDVGTFGERVFVAMEFIDGPTLRQWVKQSHHDWSDIVHAFVMAGRGLAAAHAAGLVHRDFKPDNVLMGRDGRVLVMDFGLARRSSAQSTALELPAASRSNKVTQDGNSPHKLRSAEAELMLTRTGALLGTPAYMAPEQHRGASVGPLADQFSFCVALYESLYGERPFAGNTMTSLALNVLEGEIRSKPRDSRVPDWLRRVIVRGLEPDPLDRYPSIDALLAELQRDPPQNRRPWLALSVAAAVGGAVAVAALATQMPGASACQDLPSIDESWTQARKDEVRHAFTRTGRAYAQTAFKNVENELDEAADAWSQAFAQRCAVVAKQGGDPSQDPGVQCLEQQRSRLDAVVSQFVETTDDGFVDHAVAAAQQLPTPRQCLGPQPLASTSSAAVLQSLHEAEALVHTGQSETASERLTALLATESPLDDPMTEARALLTLAQAERHHPTSSTSPRRTLEQALIVAAQGDRAELEVEAWLALIELTGLDEGRPSDARQLALAAQTAIARGRISDSRPDLLLALGRLDHAQGRDVEALEHFQRAATLSESTLSPTDLRRATVQHRIGIALEGLGRYDEALPHHLAALSLREQMLGAQHPLVGASLARVAASLVGEGRGDEAEAALIRARMLLDPKGDLFASVDDRLDPDQARDLARVLELQGHLKRSREQFEAAANLHSEAAALLERHLGPHAPEVGYALVNLGVALSDLARHETALTHLRRAVEILSLRLDPTHPDLGTAHLNLANTYWAQGASRLAARHYRIALETWEQTLAPDHPLLAYPLTGQGRTWLELDAPHDALRVLERAFELRNHQTEDALNIAETSLLLARALWATRGEGAGAFERVVAARDIVGAYEPTDIEGLRDVLEGGEVSRFTDQLTPAGLAVTNRLHVR